MKYITTAERIGMKKGIEKGVKNTAKNMLKIGLDIGLISRVTGLSEEEIRKLPKEQEHVFGVTKMKEILADKQTNAILIELKSKISQKYQLKEMRLFGSKARGESSAHSDIDVFVRISDVNRAVEKDIFDLAYEAELKYGCLIDILVFDDSRLNGIHFWTPVYQNILQEGIII